MKFVGVLALGSFVFVAAACPAFVRGQSIINPTVLQQETSISLTPGAQVYIYGQVTGGENPCGPLANGTGQIVYDESGQLAAGLAVTDQSTNSFSFPGGNFYAIAGVGVSGYSDMQAFYAQNIISGPGDVSAGNYEASVDFTLSQPAFVVALGFGSSQEGLSFSGPSSLVTDYATIGTSRETPLAVGIANAELDPGEYNIGITTSVTAPDMTLDYMADLLGVYTFTVPEPTSMGLLFVAGIGIMARRHRHP
jgi:hypothetical protein